MVGLRQRIGPYLRRLLSPVHLHVAHPNLRTLWLCHPSLQLVPLIDTPLTFSWRSWKPGRDPEIWVIEGTLHGLAVAGLVESNRMKPSARAEVRKAWLGIKTE